MLFLIFFTFYVILFFGFFSFFLPILLSKSFFSLKIKYKNLFLYYFLLMFFYIFIFSFCFYIFVSEKNIFLNISIIFGILTIIFGIIGFRKLKAYFSKFLLFFLSGAFLVPLFGMFFYLTLTFGVKPFIVSGESMSPNFYTGQFLFIDKSTKKFFVGDVVVFKVEEISKDFYIKRVIGTAGDKVKIENGEIFLQRKGENNFVKLEENYLVEESQKATGFFGSEGKIFEIPEGKYFLLGDNRAYSIDSRLCFGSCEVRDEFVNQEEIVGKVFLNFGKIDFIGQN